MMWQSRELYFDIIDSFLKNEIDGRTFRDKIKNLEEIVVYAVN